MDIENVILFQVDRTNRLAKSYSQKELDNLGIKITVDQWVLLKIVHETQPISQKEIAKNSFRDPASITRTLDLLEKKQLVTRESIPNNRRQYNIVLTKAGNEFVKDNMPVIQKQRAKSIKGFSNDELANLQTYLQRIQNNLT